MKKIIIVNEKEIYTDDISVFYKVYSVKNYIEAIDIFEKNPDTDFAILEEMDGINNFLEKISKKKNFNMQYVVLSDEIVGDKIREFFKIGAYDVIGKNLGPDNFYKTIEEMEENKKTNYYINNLESKVKNMEKEISEYQILYETTRILRIDLEFEEILIKLVDLVEGLIGGDGFFIIKERYYYSKNGRWDKIHFMKRFLKENGMSSVNELVKSFSSYTPIYFEDKILYIIPIIIKSSLKGYLLIMKDVEKSIYEHELEVITSILSQAGIVIENAFLIEEAQETSFEIVKSLVKAIEAKDKYTKGHSQRVAQISIMIAKEMDLSTERVKNIEMAAVLHDVGKIGLPEYILNKSGKLTAEEYEHMRQHPSNGYEIVSQIKNMKDIARIIRYHHERWDGKGYPEELIEEDIPLESRIIAIADTYDAITSDRPYRKGREHGCAVKEIKENKETQFDPYISKIFLNISKELIDKAICHVK